MKALVIALTLSVFLVGCSKRRATAEIANAMTEQVAQLPEVLRSIKTEEDSPKAIKRIHEIRDNILLLLEEADPEKVLTRQEQLEVERELRAVKDESAYILQGLSDKPAVLIQLASPLSELADALERASQVMERGR